MKGIAKKALHFFGYDIRKIRRRSDIAVYLRCFPEDSVKNRKFYNIGAGGFSHPCWTNVDYDSEWYATNAQQTAGGIKYDLFSLKPMPIDSNSAEVVYSSHTIEHITDEAAQNMFNEIYRILKPKGYCRITTPNIDLEYRAYREKDRDFFYWIGKYSIQENWERVRYNRPMDQASIAQIFLEHFATSVSTLHADGATERIGDDELERILMEMGYEEALNFICSKCPVEIQKKYPGNHINWWNQKKMFSMLKRAGFSDIWLSGYGQSFCPVLRDTTLFDNTHPRISLFVEATK